MYYRHNDSGEGAIEEAQVTSAHKNRTPRKDSAERMLKYKKSKARTL